ncbi:MAG: polysaccharide deacetylase family protein [Thiohalomonadales bacterium]
MKRIIIIFTLLLLSRLVAAELTVLTYHDIAANPGSNQFAVSRSMFVAHMDYLQEHGYRVLSLKELENIYHQKKAIPNKSVMLTFDDGLKSYYKFVVPVLKIYNFPSVASIVTAWVDGVNIPAEYQHKIMTWTQLREISKSTLVDVVSHSNNLHSMVLSNPQGNQAPAAVTRKYFLDNKDYESETFFRQRIHKDFNRSVERIKKELKHQPIAIVWPYGRYDSVTSNEATLLGLHLQFNLDSGPTTASVLPKINRIMLVNSRTIEDFQVEMNYKIRRPSQINALRLKLDDFNGLDSEEQQSLLSDFLDAIQASNINAIFINPFYAKGNAAFFYNEQITVAADILNRITHQLKFRLSVDEIIIDVPKIKSKKLDLPALYEDLSRLIWFTGVLVGTNNFGKIQTVMGDIGRFRPGLEYGVRNTESPAKGMHFVLFSERLSKSEQKIQDLALRINNTPVESYLLIKLESNKGKETAAMLIRMRELGVKRLGVSSGVKAFIKYSQASF